MKGLLDNTMDEELDTGKLFLVKQGNSEHDLEFIKAALLSYGFDVIEFPSGYVAAKESRVMLDGYQGMY